MSTHYQLDYRLDSSKKSRTKTCIPTLNNLDSRFGKFDLRKTFYKNIFAILKIKNSEKTIQKKQFLKQFIQNTIITTKCNEESQSGIVLWQ